MRDRSDLVAAVAAVAILCGSRAGAASATDATHPLIPSHRAVAPGTLVEGGRGHRKAPPSFRARATLLKEGSVLYGTHCATCHGADLAGRPGAPTLLGAGGAAVDFYMTTGRMPLALQSSENAPEHNALGASGASGVQVAHVSPHFDRRAIAAIDAYVGARARRSIPIPNVRTNDAELASGRRIFENNCQACHGVGGEGATAGGRWIALPLDRATTTQIGEAIRIGPGVMPRFTSAELSPEQIDAVATYVRYLATQPQTYGGATLGYLGPVSEGAVSVVVGIGILFWVVYFTGTRADGRRLNERTSPRDVPPRPYER